MPHPALLITLGAIPVVLLIGSLLGRIRVGGHRINEAPGFRFTLLSLSVWLPLETYTRIIVDLIQRARQHRIDEFRSIVGNADEPLPHFQPLPHFPEPVLKAALAATVIAASFVAMPLVRRSLWEGWLSSTKEVKPPKFLVDLTNAILLIFAVLGVMQGIYRVDLTQAIVGSTVLVGVLGFALQDLLGNVIAGVALQLSKPFAKGDWLLFKDERLEVLDINWRSTRCRTVDDLVLDIPNRTVASETLINLTAQRRAHGIRIPLVIPATHPPETVKKTVLQALADAPGVLQEPSPKVYLVDPNHPNAAYEARIWIDSEEHLPDTLDGVRTRIWHALRKAGLTPPPPSAH
jgi:small-conductance mechanosensitive channel